MNKEIDKLIELYSNLNAASKLVKGGVLYQDEKTQLKLETKINCNNQFIERLKELKTKIAKT